MLALAEDPSFASFGQIEQVDLIHGFEMGVIGKFPDNFLLRSDFEGLRLFAHELAGQIIADKGVSVWQSLATCGKSKWIAGDVILIKLPDHFQVLVQLNHFFRSAKSDEEMAVGQ